MKQRKHLSEALASLRPAVSMIGRKFGKYVPMLVMALALCVLASSGVHAQTPPAPTIPPTDTFNSSFADVQTWATSLISGPGKYVIYTMLSFIGFGLVVSWIKRSVKVH